MRKFRLSLVPLMWIVPLWAADSPEFQFLGTYKGVGSVRGAVVGPGPTEGSERLYVSYYYSGNTLEVIAVDPDTGKVQVFPNPTPSETGAELVTGPDGNIYLGTIMHAHYIRLDARTGQLKDLGRPSQFASYIYDPRVASDGKIYGGTYPQARLVRCDPKTGAVEDLGRMDPKEEYTRLVAPADDGFVYLAIGMTKANVAAYEIATGEHREILPEKYQTVGSPRIHRGRDGKAYAVIGNQNFRLEGWNAVPISSQDVVPAVPDTRLRDGRTLRVRSNIVTVTGSEGGQLKQWTLDYKGNELDIFRIGFGPDGAIYASGILPFQFLRVRAEKQMVEDVGALGGGEAYSFLARKNRLLIGGYSGLAPLAVYDPSKPFQPGSEPDKNPILIEDETIDHAWRPEAMINGPDGKVYIGSSAGYGKLGGPLVVWDIDNNRTRSFHHLIKNQSVISLAVAGKLIAGGTSVGGGGGAHATEKDAKLFLFDPKTQEKIFETVPVPGAGGITDLIAAPNKLLYGIAGRNTLFVFDPRARKVKLTRRLPFRTGGYCFNSVAIGPDRRIWGVSPDGIFRIDPKTDEAEVIAKPPRPISAGFAIDGKAIYFVSTGSVYRYTLPGGK